MDKKSSRSSIGLDEHLSNVADNLQLVADMGYGDVALAVLGKDGCLAVVADARPNTAVAPFASTRVGTQLDVAEETEAYSALEATGIVDGTRTRVARGIKFTTSARATKDTKPVAVMIKDLAEQVEHGAGAMERAFMDAAEELLGMLAVQPLRDIDGGVFTTTRTAGDGVMRVSDEGAIRYASPNAVTIMRLAGIEELIGRSAAELPGGGQAIARVAEPGTAAHTFVEVVGRSLSYRTIGLPGGALVLVEDVTEARRREAELKVKEATIREIHHRVKNNLQAIASLLRLQARRSTSDDVRHALEEATERVGSMAVVHDLLAGSDEERIDFAEAARTVVELVKRGFLGEGSAVEVRVEGSSGLVDARQATSLALAVAELVHNALDHGMSGREAGLVEVAMRRLPGELVLTVRDNGNGLPTGFDQDSSANLGLTIVRTVIEDDLRGTLTFSRGRGTTVTVRVPLSELDDAGR